MRAASLAEWTLRRLTDRHRAVSIVGDLVETADGRGKLWFYLAVAGVTIRLLWRPLLGFVAAFYVGNWTAYGLDTAVHGIHAQHRPPELWMPVFLVIMWLGRLLWISAVYLAIRYGFHDRFTQLALVMAGIVSAATCYWWQPAILTACGAACLMPIWQSVRDKERLRVALRLLGVLATGFCSFMTVFFLDSVYTKFVHPGPIGSVEYQQHPSLIWIAFFMSVAATLTTTTMCSLLNNRPLRHEGSDLKSDGTPA